MVHRDSCVAVAHEVAERKPRPRSCSREPLESGRAGERESDRAGIGRCIHNGLTSYTRHATLCYMTSQADPSVEDDDGSAPPLAGEVTVKGPGVEIVRPVDEPTMANIIALLFGAAPTSAPNPVLSLHGRGRAGGGGGIDVGTGAPSGASSAVKWDPELTLGEFLAETGASTFPQKICAAGYYKIKMQGAGSFDRDGIKAALVQAYEDMPANYTRDFANAASTSLIAPKPGEAGQYFVPTTGRKAVESHFQEVPKRRAKRARKAVSIAKSDKGE